MKPYQATCTDLSVSFHVIVWCVLSFSFHFWQSSKQNVAVVDALFAGLPDSTLAPLQRVLHAAARFVGAFNHETM